MSKTIKYHCNLCREEKNRNELLSLYWRCDIMPQQYQITTDLGKSDSHICNDCRKIIKEYA